MAPLNEIPVHEIPVPGTTRVGRVENPLSAVERR
jgi:hypothetical protein